METEYKVRLEIFEGPLDLLLYLIKRDELDIYDISLERITRQYLEYLQAFKELNIDVAGEFVVMAANLIYLKSRSLLPADQQPPEEDVEEDDPRWDLIRQLIEYKKFKEAAVPVADARAGAGTDFRPDRRRRRRRRSRRCTSARSGIFQLINAFQNVLKRLDAKEDLREMFGENFTVSDKIERIMQSRPAGRAGAFFRIVRASGVAGGDRGHVSRPARIDPVETGARRFSLTMFEEIEIAPVRALMAANFDRRLRLCRRRHGGSVSRRRLGSGRLDAFGGIGRGTWRQSPIRFGRSISPIARRCRRPRRTLTR